MAVTRGRCTNFDYCSVAEARRDVEIRVGEDFVCPECGKPLKAPRVKGGSTSPLVPVLIIGGVLALAAGAGFLGLRMGGMRLGGVRTAGTRVVGTRPLPAASPAAPAPPPMSAAGAPPPAQSAAVTTPAPVAAVQVPAAAGLAKPAPGSTVLFQIHGSGGMVAIVAPLAAAYLTQSGDTNVGGSRDAGETRVTGTRAGMQERIEIVPDGTEAGLAALRSGADIIMSPRRILPSESASLASLGDMTSPQAEHALGLDAQALIVNPNNTVPFLSRDQMRDVLSGRITDWRAVGLQASPIAVYAAPADKDIVLATGLITDAPGARHVPDGNSVARSVADDPHGVGVVDLTSIGAARVVPVMQTGGAPVSPTDHAAVLSDEYPLAYRLYLYTSPSGLNGFAQRFIDYAMSASGQGVLQQQGLISPMLTQPRAAPTPTAPPPRQTDADRLRSFVKGAKRLAIVFRFRANSTDLDQYGERDLDRVTNYLISLHDDGSHLLLAGFADNQGDAETNVAVSRKRADAVAALFVSRGLKPGGVAGFGSQLPAGNNETDAGRQRNRRVEVYIRP